MKLIDLVIVFIIIVVPFNLITAFQNKIMKQAIHQQIEMNHILDTAIMDGVSLLVEKGDRRKISLNKESCVSAFYNTLFVNMNITADEYAKTKLMGYIPAIIILDYDGYYALSCETFKGKDNSKQIKPVWHSKKTYAYREGSYIYGFTMDDYVTVYCIDTQEFTKGRQQDLKTEIEYSLLQDNQLFEDVRRRTIIESLQNDINRLINKHNDVARQFGISYQFALPVIEEEDWYQTVDNIGMLVFFQGMPIGVKGTYYNQYAFGGAQLIKSEGYYIQDNEERGLSYYHRSTCDDLTDKSLRHSSPEECALKGAFPCEKCKP